jgi:hypothetical protein
MFNDLKVSSSIDSQVSNYFASEYPTFVSFLKEYYAFLETNSNPLDILGNIEKLINIDTYTSVTPYAILSVSIDANDTEIEVYEDVNFPPNDGLLKIEDEVILYKTRSVKTVNGQKRTVFSGCTRGYTYNDLSVEGVLSPNIVTVADSYNASNNIKVYNQGFTYILYILEKIREQYLVDFPKQALEKNIENVNVDTIIKRIRDFYISKGTPKAISFYFKFLYQENADIINYRDLLMASSDAIYQNKEIVRIETLDNYPLSLLADRGCILVQGTEQFPVQTVENVFSFASQVFEIEISNGRNLIPTYFTKVTTQFRVVDDIAYVYVDSTSNFDREGTLRIGDKLFTYFDKQFNYFILKVSENPTLLINTDDYVYDVNTLARVKELDSDIIEGSYFIIYAGVSDFEIIENSTYYQTGDLGFVTNLIDETNLLVTSWTFNDITPIVLNENIVAGITQVYTDIESVYVYTSSIPFYSINPNQVFLENNNLKIINANIFKKIPKVFDKSVDTLQQETNPNDVVGILRDGSYIHNWKSEERIINGKIENINIVNGGDNFAINNPPELKIESPLIDAIGDVSTISSTTILSQANQVYLVDGSSSVGSQARFEVIRDNFGSVISTKVVDNLAGNNYEVGTNITIDGSDVGGLTEDDDISLEVVSIWSGEQATAEMVVSGRVSEVYIKNGGVGYPSNTTFINVIRDVSDTVYSGNNFRDAVLSPIVVDGKITKVRIIDPGEGYTKSPTIVITPELNIDNAADIELQIGGPVTDVTIVNPGKGYRINPSVDIVRGLGASGILSIDNGVITSASIITGGSQYNSRPVVRVVDTSAQPGFGAILLAEWDSNSKQVQEIKILNGGIGYDELNTIIEIFEPGENLILNTTAKFYTKVNNTNPNLSNLIRTDLGAYYAQKGITTDDQGNETFLSEYSIIAAPFKLQLKDPLTNEIELVNLQNALDHSPLIGWALDGAPIYGPYGYSNPLDPDSDPAKMRSGYKLLSQNNLEPERKANRNNGGLETDYAVGEFEQDYIWTARNADLDSNNGRFCKTPDYPLGVYAYFMTASINPNQPSSVGFPYFIGPKFSGKIDTDFNNQQFLNLEAIPNLSRYLDFRSNIAPKPIDPGFFEVASIPSSAEASLDFIDIITPGSGYKFGDVVNFNNEGTGGSGAASFVSVLKGKTISSVTKATYDYLEYRSDVGSFNVGDQIKTIEGFSATIYSVDSENQNLYLSNVLGDLPNPDNRDSFYNTTLTVDTQSVSELVGPDASAPIVTASLKFASLNEASGISDIQTTFLIDNFNNSSITDFNQSSGNPVYVRVNTEIMRVISTQSTNRLLVTRGINSTPSAHNNNSTVEILSSIPVYDSSKFSIGDYIEIDSEKMRIIDTVIQKNTNNEVVAVRINDGTGTQSGIQYYLYFNGYIQNNGGDTSTVVTIDGNGDISDIIFTPGSENYISNPIAYISTDGSYSGTSVNDAPPSIVSGVDLTATTYSHTLIVERSALATVLADHNPRTEVNRLFFSTAETLKYEEDRIVTKLNSSDNGLVVDDFVTISASTENEETFNIYQPGGQLKLSNGVNFNSAYPNGLTLYENSKYVFEVSYTNPNWKNIEVRFFTPGTDTKKEYFDIKIEKEFNVDGKLTKFVLLPDDSDLSKVNMEVKNVNNNGVTIIPLIIKSEPINGSYNVINSGSTFFEIYSKINPDPDGTLLNQYNLNKISYTTTSKSSDGPIERVTLTNNGVNYQQVPRITSISTVDGEGAILEAVSDKVGTIKSVKAINSGYGYSPDPTQKPTLIFPVISKLKNNFTIESLTINNPGDGYLFSPRMQVVGGGLQDDSPNHAKFEGVINSRIISNINTLSSGIKYNSAPTVTAEKYYYISTISGSDINFNISFKEFFQEGDPFRIRAYYFANLTDAANQVYSYIESNTFYAFLGNVSLKARAQGGIVNLLPLDQAYWTVDIENIITNPANGIYYEAVNFARNAQFTAIMKKSPFSNGERVSIIRSIGDIETTIGSGEISTINGWQENNSILRITGITTKLKKEDEIIGLNTLAVGVVDETFSVKTSAKLDAVVQTPEQFLDDGSFIGSNALKIQDSNRYQKFAYQVGVQTPFVEWRENYENALHPAGYKVFSKTQILSSPEDSILHENFRDEDDEDTSYDERDLIKEGNSIVNVGTTSAELAQLRRKYNFLVAKNENNRFDSVIVKNKLLTDVLNIKTSIVGVFEDISDQFNGIETLFELKVIDPVTPIINGSPNYIIDYEVDQMVVLLDNIIQTYGTSWEIIDADKVIDFYSQQLSGDPMPDGEMLKYRQFNEANSIFTMNQTSTATSSVFDLNQTDGTAWPSGVFTSIDNDEYLVFVDGIIQKNNNFSISAGGGSPTITFTDDDISNTPIALPIGTQISVRQSNSFIKNEFYTGSGGVFTPGNVSVGTPIVLPNKTSGPSSKHDYFVFVDGVIISPDDYGLDTNKDILFNYGFNYDTLIVIIDINGASLAELSHGINGTKYVYKIEDGQLEIPTGFEIKPEQYLVDISGVVQSPHIVYNTRSSGVRKIRFFEPPSRYILPDVASDRSEIGRQFIGFLYERLDPEGNTTTPNYQFDDVSISKVHVKEGFDNFVTGDYINTATSSAVIKRKEENVVIKSISLGFSGSLASGATTNITISSTLKVYVGDRVLFNSAFGLTSTDNDELEITAINGNVITLTNISSSALSLVIPTSGTIRFIHRELTIVDIVTTEADRDDAFADTDVLESGIVSSIRTGVQTLTNEPFAALVTDTEITVDNASGFTTNDYLLINAVEIVKITNISTNTLTVDRAQLSTSAVLHPDGIVVEKITPYTLTVNSFIRGFDSDKTVFPLKENGEPVNIGTDKDIFVIVNGILQKKGVNDSYVINITGTAPNEYSVLSFTEAPPEGAPLNVFYLGEVKPLKDMSGLFNGTDRAFNLINPTNDEVFSLIAESRPEANISANLIIFIDGSLQIPSTEEAGRVPAYPNSLVSYKLFGSIVEYSAPPQRGATFEGYIYVGSNDDFEEIDVDPPVERGDIIIQGNERRPREVNLVVSADKLSVGSSFGQLNNVPNASRPLLNDGTTGYWFTDLLQSADVRETLRVRRSLRSKILRIDATQYPITQSTLLTAPIGLIDISNISDNLPVSTDSNSFMSVLLAANDKFPQRKLNCIYSSFGARQSNQTTNYDFTPSQIISSDTFQLTTNTGVYDSHSLVTGATVTYSNQTNTSHAPLVNGLEYYVYVVDQHKIKLATNKYNLDNGIYVNITSTETGTHRFSGKDVDSVGNLTVGFDLKYDQIVRLDSSASGKTYEGLVTVSSGEVGSLSITEQGTGFPNGTSSNVNIQSLQNLSMNSTITGGLGYDNGVYTNLQLTGGSGNGARANIEVTNGSVTKVTIISTGSNTYSEGDTLSAVIPNGSGFLYTLGSDMDSPGTGCTVNVTVFAGVVTSVTVVNRGSDYIDGQSVGLEGFNNVRLKISPIDDTIYYNNANNTAKIINYTSDETLPGAGNTRYLYVKLDDSQIPITTYATDNAQGTITTAKNISYQVEEDDLMIKYQSLSYNDDFIYDF